MAALHSPAAQQVVGGWAAGGPGTATGAPATLRLRDSCHGCAASKLKCSKEKPTCARCAKRGRVCEYFATRRAGRKQASRTSDHPDGTRTVPAQSTTSTTSSSSGTDTAAPQDTIQAFLSRHTSVYPDILPSPVFTTEPPAFSLPTPADLNLHDFDDYFDPALSFSLLEAPDDASRTEFHPSSMDMDSSMDTATETTLADNTFSILDDTSTQLTSPSEFHISRPSTTGRLQTSRDLSSESPCGCLMYALGLLQQLCPDASTRCTAWPGQSSGDRASRLRTIQAVIAKNEHTIDTISNMLPCSCSQDGYLLAIIALVVFKALEQYAAAVREMLPDHPSNPSKPHPDGWLHHSEQVLKSTVVVGGGSDAADGEDQGRIAAQQVLSELHRVQRLVNALSPRLKEHGARNRGDGPSTAISADGQDLASQRDGAFPFSTTLLDQLEDDLRKGLRALSAEIVYKLRRE